MSKQKSNYHHGDLCQSLIATASELIREHGVEALSMRKLADHVGVSRTAPYHHYKDKNELLCAIAEEGFRLQRERVGQFNPDSSTDNAAEQFELLMQHYIEFAIEHPAHYELMYGGNIWKHKRATPSLEKAAKETFKQWLIRIEALQTADLLTRQESALRVAQVTWATMHGLCRLANDGIYIDQQDVVKMGRSAVHMMLLSGAQDSYDSHHPGGTRPASSPSNA